ncbi:MAG TPA: thiamine pyrophosphate-binding protein [Actinocrinis sp.]|uniref:thiamine pyrophosphate-binding protein n=1 Tax=Actinocrinis sp. TaxID=1920516 RepID=UPI002DDCB56D|nr:thiamine pyrophosphate-binding protein [Actinocrinis sp.]HEV2347625.1 thiamine pyrophosphate-binding protein [Actinocrinis sp.]
MIVAEAVGRALFRAGAETVFGLVGSGNFHVTNALIGAGARFVPARHEGGAATMADAHARAGGGLGVLSVHQGPGLTNAMTGLAEAAKSRTPLLVLAAEATSLLSNFWIDSAALAGAVGIVPMRIQAPGTAVADALGACTTAIRERRTVLLSLPLDVQAAQYTGPAEAETRFPHHEPAPCEPSELAVSDLVAALEAARRPVFIAGRGARLRGAREPLRSLAQRCGALLATSAAARGLFIDDPCDLDVSGGFATPLAAGLIRGADLIVGWGCALNMWTLRHGSLVGEGAVVVQVDSDPVSLGAHQPINLGVHGDVSLTARAALARLGDRSDGGYRSPELAVRLKHEGRWRDVPYREDREPSRIDPRTLSIALNELIPRERTIAIDSGNFMGYPAMYLDVPDVEGMVFTQAFQSVGLGLATAIGATVARPDRLTVAALGDGGALMGIAELETAVRLGLGLLIVVYNDAAYGAEVHHFGPHGHPLGTVRFPDTDLAAIGRGFGCDAVTVRAPEELTAVTTWLDGPRDHPMLVDAKITTGSPSWWLEEAFRGH